MKSIIVLDTFPSKSTPGKIYTFSRAGNGDLVCDCFPWKRSKKPKCCEHTIEYELRYSPNRKLEHPDRAALEEMVNDYSWRLSEEQEMRERVERKLAEQSVAYDKLRTAVRKYINFVGENIPGSSPMLDELENLEDEVEKCMLPHRVLIESPTPDAVNTFAEALEKFLRYVNYGSPIEKFIQE